MTMPELEDAGLNVGSGGGGGGSVVTGLNLTGDGTLATPVKTLAVGLKFGTGTNFNETGQGNQGTTWRDQAIADGTLASPVDDARNPTFLVQRSDASVGGILPFQFTFERQGGDGIGYALHSFARVSATTVGDTVAVTGSTFVEAVSSPSSTPYGGWFLCGRNVQNRAVGMQVDVQNYSGVDAANDDDSPTNSCIGAAIVCSGDARNSVGLAFQSGNLTTSQFFTGLQFDMNTCKDHGILFKANSVEGYPIDFYPLGNSIVAFRLANGQAPVARKNADDGDLYLFELDNADRLRFRNDTAFLFASNDALTTYGQIEPTQIRMPHYQGNTGTPAIAAGAAAGTGPSVSVDGNDFAGTITITTGTSTGSNGILATVTFDTEYAQTPRPVISYVNAAAASLAGNAKIYVNQANTTTTKFEVWANNGGVGDGATYIFNYVCCA